MAAAFVSPLSDFAGQTDFIVIRSNVQMKTRLSLFAGYVSDHSPKSRIGHAKKATR